MNETPRKTLHEQAQEKLAARDRDRQDLAAWERELARPDYYDWFLDRVQEPERSTT